MDGLLPNSVFYGFNKDKNVSNIVVEYLQAHVKKLPMCRMQNFTNKMQIR